MRREDEDARSLASPGALDGPCCVYAGSNLGADAQYRSATQKLGRALVERGIGVVYGGGNVGLMGVLADTVLEQSGEVIGVIPRSLVAKEVAHKGLMDLRVVDSMHERKATMAELSDAFVALPGGIGTVEELTEAYTWTQLGLHRKPCALLNVNGYYDRLVGFLDHAVDERFLRREHRDLMVVADQPADLLARLERFEPPRLVKWLDREGA
jgi:uncharacterized protein (TIGR00730 family)